MEKYPQNPGKAQNAGTDNNNLNANSAYNGSGSMQPGGGTPEAGKLSDYPESSANHEKLQTDSIPGNQTDQPYTEADKSNPGTDE